MKFIKNNEWMRTVELNNPHIHNEVHKDKCQVNSQSIVINESQKKCKHLWDASQSKSDMINYLESEVTTCEWMHQNGNHQTRTKWN